MEMGAPQVATGDPGNRTLLRSCHHGEELGTCVINFNTWTSVGGKVGEMPVCPQWLIADGRNMGGPYSVYFFFFSSLILERRGKRHGEGEWGGTGQKEPENGQGTLVVGTEVSEPPKVQTCLQGCSRKVSRAN